MYENMRLRQIRHDYSVQGWALLIYFGIMNVAVSLLMGLESIYRTITALGEGAEVNIEEIEDQLMANSGWGYLLAIAVGALILLLWKKPGFCFGTVWEKGKPMTVGSFFAILAIFMSGQLVFQIVMVLLELFFNRFGFSLMEALESVSVSTDSLSMFLYAGLGAPISEEILFRGLVLRSMEPYGKKFAIFGSALLFGLFHGNLIQTPFAFVVGLVLGYVALEYNIGWAMVLHMFNNLIISDTLTRLVSNLPGSLGDLLIWAVIIAFSIAALVVLITKRGQIAAYLRRERNDPLCTRAFFTAPGIIVLLVVLFLNIAVSMLSMMLL